MQAIVGKSEGHIGGYTMHIHIVMNGNNNPALKRKDIFTT